MKLKYYLCIAFSVVGLGLVVGSSLFALYNFKKLSTVGYAIVIVGIIIGLLVIKISGTIRRDARQAMQTDEYGNKTKG